MTASSDKRFIRLPDPVDLFYTALNEETEGLGCTSVIVMVSTLAIAFGRFWLAGTTAQRPLASPENPAGATP